MRRAGLSALALAVCTSGCGTNPFIFNERLNTYRAADRPTMPAPHKPDPGLAGDLDLSLGALMAQREDLWRAAGDTETMKNLTALGLIGLGAVGLYKGFDSELNKTWLRKAGLGAAAVYGGARWLEPTERQKIYLAGATSLTCLALAAAPYEMTKGEFQLAKQAVDDARAALEKVFFSMNLLGDLGGLKHQYRIKQGVRRQALFAHASLRAAEQTLGNIEGVGPRLREMTAMTASEVGKQVALVSRDLSQVPAAILALKADTNTLISKDIFTLPKQDAASTEGTGGDAAEDNKAAAGATSASCPAESDDKKDEKLDAKLLAKAVATAESAASAATAAAERANKSAAKIAASVHASGPGPTPAFASDHLGWVDARMTDLVNSFHALSAPLGKALAMVRRIETARIGQTLPEACGAQTPIRLIPGDRSIALKPGASFQFVLSGDTGRPSAQFLTEVLGSNVLDISLPAMQATNSAVRFTAGTTIDKQADTIVRISDSKQLQHFEVSVRVCKSGGS